MSNNEFGQEPVWGPPAPRPEFQQSTPTSQPSGPGFQSSAPYPPAGYGPRPQYSSYPQPPRPPAPGSPPPTPAKQKRGLGLASVVLITMLAAGVGGGSGFVASRYLDAPPSASPSAPAIESTAPTPTETTQAPGGGHQTTVVQADATNPDWAAVAEAASKAVVAIQVSSGGQGGQGSGVVIDGEGHVVTNNHVVAGPGADAQITVLLGNTAYRAEAVGFDPSTDLAVIKMVNPPSDLAVMGYGDSKALKVGDPVMAIGNPLGLADTVTTGIVSALNRPVTTRAVSNENASQTRDSMVVTAAIQTNAAINPGNSGGALVNTAGELVGITSSIASLSATENQAGNIGIGFAIGADQVQYVVEQLISTGKAEHPQLGVSASDVQTYGPMGARIVEVVPGSPAEDAGLKVDDQVTAVDGQPVTSTESLVALVRAGRVGEEMKLTVLRGGEEMVVSLTPTAAPR